MKIVNGKLFGQPRNDLDIFKENIERRCERLESFLSTEQQQQVTIYKQGLEKVYYLQQVLGRQIKDLEINQSNWLEKSLANSDRAKSTKLLWLNFSSSLILGSILIFGWFDYDSQHQCQAQKEPIKISISQNKNSKIE
jgi:hypothetical protein